VSRPLIGVTTYLSPADWGVWKQQRAALLPVQYPAQVQAAGGIAAMLPPDDPSVAADAVSRLDGLIVSGGPDVAPELYGAARDPRTDPPSTERDAWELALIGAALERGLPLLAICRGMQLLNVARGGELEQYLPDRVGHRDHAPEPGVYAAHPVTPVPGTLLAQVLGAAALDVPTYHRQAVRRLGAGLTVSAHAADGTVEAVELPGATGFVLAVQWHPEQGTDLRLVRALLNAAAGGYPTAGSAHGVTASRPLESSPTSVNSRSL